MKELYSEYVEPNFERKTKRLNEHIAKAPRLSSGMPSFSHIEFSICDLCNRVCVFCPRANPDVYPNNNEHMSIELYTKIIRELAEEHYQGSLSFSGFSEPLLHKQLDDFIRCTKEWLPNNELRMNTNGDKLTAERVRELYDLGLNTIIISLYDGPEQIEPFKEMARKAGVPEDWLMLRARFFPEEEGFGITLSNRAGMVTELEHLGIKALEEAAERPCHYPLYIMMVDFDGRVLLCAHDWGKRLTCGDLNNQTVTEVWSSRITDRARRRLMGGDRKFSPCDVCDVVGTIQGAPHRDIWDAYYGESREQNSAS